MIHSKETRIIRMTYAIDEENPNRYLHNTLNKLLMRHNVYTGLTWTGIGKLGSYIHTQEDIIDDIMGNWRTLINAQEAKPNLVINVGTCGGSSETKPGDILVCNRFIDLDMTEIERMGYQNMTVPITVGNFDGVTCGTSDKFVLKEFDYENLHAYDMEAYPQARLCTKIGIPFVSVKCVTDIVGQNTHEDYRFNREMAMKKLGEFITPEFILSHMNN